jgi:hypothetical protein
MLTLGYKVDEVEELCDIIQEIIDNGNHQIGRLKHCGWR